MSKVVTDFNESLLFGENAPFVEELYEEYRRDPESVAPEWRQYFAQLQQPEHGAGQPGAIPQRAARRGALPVPAELEERVLTAERKQIVVLQLINAYRFLGFRQADLDPLNHQEKPHVPELDPGYYGLTEADMSTVFGTGSLVGPPRAPLRDIIQALRQTYCGSTGIEYMYITDTEQKRWIQDRIEGIRAQPDYPSEYKRHILERLTAAESLEKYLHTRYVGQKRFSGEGAESLIPLLDTLLQRVRRNGCAAANYRHGPSRSARRAGQYLRQDTRRSVPGIRRQASPGVDRRRRQISPGLFLGGLDAGGIMRVSLAFNPSHLEIVDPVVEGSVRARQHRLGDREGDVVLPALLHGDAAYSAQGVVMETLNLSQTRGFGTGGTVHVVINNQIGFTTSDPRDARSTLYSTDVSKMIEAPIFHVNGDDPEAVVLVTEIALDFRMKFHKDVVVDLVCFRALGHNEQDEPMVTQPLMYKIIAKHPGTRKLYADKLEAEGVIAPGEADAMVKAYRDEMDAGRNPNKTIVYGYKAPDAVDWTPYLKNAPWDIKVKTGLPMPELKELAERVTDIPDKFKLHPRVEKIIADRRAMGEGKLPLDWGMAETLAYAALLKDGYGVRISGQDSGRGTFFHRHAVLHDQNRERWDEDAYVPLRHIAPDQPDFTIIDSLLSEEAVLGFEYGYATAEPEELVVWEAQFGDFANGAQVVIDQFIASGEAKWGRLCGLVMMLPHGYEGQGPEHSSARLERYLQLCAEYNIQVCVPSTPAQMFHALRRQMVRPLRKPLILMSPKSLLRHKESVSSLADLANGSFQAVIPEAENLEPLNIRRMVACSGKVYYDLVAYRREHKITDVAIIRIEQLYPFPHKDFKAEVDRYSKAKDLVWCQEEPGNQGAWHRIQHYLARDKRSDQVLGYALRPSSASPAVGYFAKHNDQQKKVIAAAFREKI